jgi:hypothetical protein
MIGSLGAGAAALAANAAVARQEKGKEQAAHAHPHGPEHDQHLATLARCAQVCNETAHHCLMELAKGGPDAKAHAAVHGMAMDCQAFCVLAGTLMARHSPLQGPAHAACAEACARCAEVCEKHADAGAVVKECAEACRACEKACRAMSKDGDHHAH